MRITLKSPNGQHKSKLPWAVTRWATKWPTSSRLRLFLQGGRNNFWWKIQVRPQKLNPVIGKIPVVVHPSKCLTNIFLGFEALHELNNLEIRNVNLRVLCKVEVLLCIANSLYRFKTKSRWVNADIWYMTRLIFLCPIWLTRKKLTLFNQTGNIQIKENTLEQAINKTSH